MKKKGNKPQKGEEEKGTNFKVPTKYHEIIIFVNISKEFLNHLNTLLRID